MKYTMIGHNLKKATEEMVIVLLPNVRLTYSESIDDDFYQVDYVVCHGDLNHNNFLVSADEQLYLVDWDNVRVADPLSDITLLLVQYFSPSDWMEWFEAYDFNINESFYKRVRWYSILNCLCLIKQYFNENRHHKLNEFVLLLKNIYENN